MNKQEDTDSVLAKVNFPQDIRGLSTVELSRLAAEIREMIIAVVSRSGGHLASSLGAVELTLAIHRVFETPHDKLVWDVGHQAYAHKIITGRKGRFHTLRQKGGLSGFPKRAESPYDVLDVGHSSTSISAAAGMAEGRCLKGEDFKIVVVIGDGSMTAGMAYEGLNWAGDRRKDLIIILNDNEMSISANVGAMSSYLNRVMTGQTVTRLKTEIKQFFKTIPSIGDQMIRFSHNVEEALKSLVVPGALFEELGFTYVGPLEGHRLDHLIKNLENVKNMKGPVLVHVLTKKGKGYTFAEDDPSRFHGIAPFCVETGATATAERQRPAYTQVFGATLIRLAKENKKIVAITAAMCDGTGLNLFAQEFPDRFFDVGIAEQHAVTFAAGLALEGFIPVAAIYSTFLQRAYDQVLHDVCLQKIPVVLALDRSGFVGDDGPTHHGLFDLSYLRAIPNLVIMAPKDENEFQHMLKTAVACGGPAAVRYPRGAGTGAVMDDAIAPLEIGRAEIVRDGTHIGILAVGATVYPAMAAADKLRQEGIHARVVNARFVKPLDAELISETACTLKKIITVEENVLMGGFGSAVMEMLEQRGIQDVRVKRLGVSDEFVAHATQAELRSQYGIDEAGIVRAVRSMLERHQGQAG